MTIRAVAASLTIALCLATAPARADMTVAYQLLDSGEYEAAYQEFLPHAREGNPDAQIEIGLMFLNGNLAEDDASALYWIEAAAEQEAPFAQYVLGWMYHFGEGVEADPVRAVTLYEPAAREGIIPAQRLMGVIFAYGADGIEIDYDVADAWFEQAVANGDASAMNSYSWSLLVRGERYLDALDLATRSVALEPDISASIDTLGTAFLVLDRYNAAAKSLELAVELEPDYPGFIARLGDAYYGMGEVEAAREAWQQALDLAIDYDEEFDELWDPFAIQDNLDDTAPAEDGEPVDDEVADDEAGDDE